MPAGVQHVPLVLNSAILGDNVFQHPRLQLHVQVKNTLVLKSGPSFQARCVLPGSTIPVPRREVILVFLLSSEISDFNYMLKAIKQN